MNEEFGIEIYPVWQILRIFKRCRKFKFSVRSSKIQPKNGKRVTLTKEGLLKSPFILVLQIFNTKDL